MKLIGHAHLHRLHFSDKHTGIVDVQTSSMGFMCLNPITFFPVYPGSYWHDFVFLFFFWKAPRVHLQLCIHDAVRPPVLPVWTCANLSCSIIHPGPFNVNGVFLRFLVWMVRLRARVWGASSWPRRLLTCRRDSEPCCSVCPVVETRGRLRRCPRSFPKSPTQRKKPVGETAWISHVKKYIILWFLFWLGVYN